MIHYDRIGAATLVLVALGCGGDPFGDEGQGGALPFDEPVVSAIEHWDDDFYTDFVVVVPDDAAMLRIQVEEALADLDLYVRPGAKIDSFEAEDVLSEENGRFNDVLVVDYTSEIPLQPGALLQRRPDDLCLSPAGMQGCSEKRSARCTRMVFDNVSWHADTIASVTHSTLCRRPPGVTSLRVKSANSRRSSEPSS